MDLTIPCEFCGLTNFNSRKEFSNHLASHQREFLCKEPHCNKTFLTRDKMRFHKRTAHSSPVNCQCCDKEFKTEKLMRNHVKEKNFKETCSHCQTEFNNPRSYKVHLKSHGNSEFKCDDCGKICLSKASLSFHLKDVHSTNQCVMCKKVFPNKRNMIDFNTKNI